MGCSSSCTTVEVLSTTVRVDAKPTHFTTVSPSTAPFGTTTASSSSGRANSTTSPMFARRGSLSRTSNQSPSPFGHSRPLPIPNVAEVYEDPNIGSVATSRRRGDATAPQPAAVHATQEQRTPPWDDIMLDGSSHLIGRGHFGEVCRVCKVRELVTTSARSSTDLPEAQAPYHFAMKVIQLNPRRGLKSQLNEVVTMAAVPSHPNLCRTLRFRKTPGRAFLLMEFCERGDFSKFLTNGGAKPEAYTRVMMKQLLEGVHHLHVSNVLHRDLKPENLLLTAVGSQFNDHEVPVVKIADFGVARPVRDSSRTFSGTLSYVAPELHLGRQSGKPSDMWSVGLIVFIMLGGYHPFDEAGRGFLPGAMLRRVVKNNWTFMADPWDAISDLAKDLISRLLVLDPEQRLTAEEALNHPWFFGVQTIASRHPSGEQLDGPRIMCSPAVDVTAFENSMAVRELCQE